MDPEPEQPVLAYRIAEMSGMDTIDSCRIRLLSLRARVEINWPTAGGILRRNKGLGKDTEATIADLLVALPSPLPLAAGEPPLPIITDTDTDLRAVAGRAVDAALALLVGNSLDAVYPGEVRMLESYRPGAREPIVVDQPTVGLLVATIIGTLDAISERLGPIVPPRAPVDGSSPVALKSPTHGKAAKDSRKGGTGVRRP
jgi:hypothetical protein